MHGSELDHEFVPIWISRLARACRQLPAFVTASLWRTICNGWTTTKRFPGPTRSCVFGCPHSDDCIKHYLQCDSLRDALIREITCDRMRYLLRRNMKNARLLTEMCLSEYEFLRLVLITDVVYTSWRLSRGSAAVLDASGVTQCIRARFRDYAGRSVELSRLVSSFT